MVSKRLHLLLIVLVLVVPACQAPPTPARVTIPDTTRIVDARNRALLTAFDVDTGALRFSEATPFLEELTSGDVLVSEPTRAAPYGFLRRVVATATDASGVSVTTEPAGLADAISEGSLHAQGDFKPDDLIASEAYYPNITMGAVRPGALAKLGVLPGYDFYISFDQTLLDVDKNGVKAKVKVTGEVSLKAGYNVGVDISPCAKFPPVCVDSVTATMGYDEHVSIAIAGEATAKLAREFKVGQYYFKPLVLFVGPVPVVFLPTLAVYLGASGEISLRFEYGLAQRVVSQVGARWDGNTWEDISAVDVHLDPIKDVALDGAFNAELYVKPTTALLLYGTAGFTVALQPGLRMSASPNRDPFWKLDAVIKGIFGAGVELPFAGHLTNIEHVLFDKTIPLKEAPNLPPKITLFENPAKADLGKPYYLLDLRPEGLCGAFFCVQDPEGGVLNVQLTSSLEGALPTGAQYAFKVAGTHAITITATDPKGQTTQAVLSLTVVNAPPDILFSYFDDTVAQGVPYFVNVGADDLNSGTLDCSSLRWAASSPDVLTTELGASVGCNVVITFGQMGARTVTVTATDPQGAKTQKILTVTVTDPPAIKPPGISAMKVVDVDTGRQIQTGDKVAFGKELKLSVAVSNPDNLPIEYSWSVSNDIEAVNIGDQPEMVWAAGYPIGEGSPVRILLSVFWGDFENQPMQRLDFSVGTKGPR